MKKQLLLFAVMVFVSFKTVSAITHQQELQMRELQAASNRFAKTGSFNQTMKNKMNHLQSQSDRFARTPAKPKAGWVIKRQEKAAQESARAGSRPRY